MKTAALSVPAVTVIAFSAVGRYGVAMVEKINVTAWRAAQQPVLLRGMLWALFTNTRARGRHGFACLAPCKLLKGRGAGGCYHALRALEPLFLGLQQFA